jgi:predicted glycoside hydrolase/deacetylase ChbG (UPF0249 family)
VTTRSNGLAERLGHPPDAKLVILSCDDLGSCHAANVGVFESIRHGVATCASLMVPAPWARHAAALYEPTDDIGVHLTLNAEHELYRWGPFRELKAQVERALAWGIDVTHLAPHLTAITLRPEFFDIYLELAVTFRVPMRVPSTVTEEQAGFPFRKLAGEAGVVFPDHFDHDWRAGSRERVTRALHRLEPGVTEMHVQPAIDTPEGHALTPLANDWIDDHAFVTATAPLPQLIESVGATLIGYRELRDAMRASG